MTDEPMNPPSPFSAPLWDVLARYAAGESPAGEAETVRRWLAADPRRAELLSSLAESIGTLAAASSPSIDVENALRRVRDRLREPEIQSSDGARMRSRWGGGWLRAAAAIAFLAGAGLVWRVIDGPPVVNTTSSRTYTTRVGQSDSVRLPDGTLAILGPGSTIETADSYGAGSRKVELRGQAFFQVTHDQERPFVVHAGNATVEDLGTAFSVRDDGEDMQVVVTEGSVRLHGSDGRQGTSQSRPATPASDKGVVLRAGDRGSVGRDGRVVAERSAATPDDLAWTRGRLLFEDAPLSRVRSDLRRWYGIELLVADSALAARHLTASFSGEPVPQVLDVISLALGARIERRGDTAFVRAK